MLNSLLFRVKRCKTYLNVFTPSTKKYETYKYVFIHLVKNFKT